MRVALWGRKVAAAALALGVAVVIAASSAFAAASDDSILIKGNRRIDAAAIRAHFKGNGTDSLDPAAINAALKELYATGEFEDIKISRAGSRLIVKVVEAPTIAQLQFEGNKHLKDKDLNDAVTLRARGPLTKAAVHNDVERIIEYYHQAGRYDVEVTPKTIAHGEGRVDLVFEIKEGGKTGVKHIVFVGNRSFAESRLKGVIKTSESDWLAFFRTNDVYDIDRLENDGELLRHFYRKNGFADVRVSASGAYDTAEKGFIITYAIDEGDRYTLGSVNVVSRVESLNSEKLNGVVPLTAGKTFDGEAVDKTVEDIATAAAKAGFPFVAVRSHVSHDASPRIVDVVFTVDDGPHDYIERIVINGNMATREEVIRREFDIAEGDAYNRALVDRALRRLKALPLFKSVKITTEKGSAPDRIILNVKVEEKQTGNFAISGGYSTSAGIIGEVTVSEQNFLGLGQFVKVSLTIGQYLRGGNLSWREPYFLDTPMSLGVDLFYKEVLTSPYQSYGSTTYGAAIKIGAPVADGLTSEARYSLVNQGLSLDPALMDCSATNPPPACLYNGEASAAIKQAVLNGPQWVSSVGSTIAYNTLDNPKNPHEGLRVEVRQDVAGLGGDVDFLRSTGDVRYYHDLGNDIVGMVRGQAGYITPYGGQTLPVMNGFFGGPQLVRGFAVNGFGPRDLTPGTTQDNIGGSKYWATSGELQAPIPGLPPEIALKTAVFADAGSLWGYKGATSFPNLSPSLMTVGDSRQVRSSIGSSLIWDSPFGPLRVDYAYPLTKTPYDVTQRLNFGFGGF